MNMSQMRWYVVRRGFWRGILASLFGSAVFAVFVAITFFALEHESGGSQGSSLLPPERDLWPLVLTGLALPFLFPFVVGLMSSVIPGCFGGSVIGLTHHIFASRNLSPSWTLVAGFFVGGIAGYVSSELAMKLAHSERYWDFVVVACVVASLCGAWVGRRLASDYKQRILTVGTGTH